MEDKTLAEQMKQVMGAYERASVAGDEHYAAGRFHAAELEINEVNAALDEFHDLIPSIIRQLTDIIKAQHEALEWYADERNYWENPDAILRNTFVGEDRGKRATQLLALSAPIVKGEQ